MSNLKKALFISPHLDDAVFSCGALIHRLSGNMEVPIFSVFAGTPTKLIVRKFMTEDENLIFSSDTIIKRLQEDYASSNILKFKVIHADFLEAIFRQDNLGNFIYNTIEELFSEPNKFENSLISKLSLSLKCLPLSKYDLIFVPRSIGNHVDHQVTQKAIENLCTSEELHKHSVIFYEDFPYCTICKTENNMNSKLFCFQSEQWIAKIEAILCYESQISMFWSSRLELESELLKYSRSISCNSFCRFSDCFFERFWFYNAE